MKSLITKFSQWLTAILLSALGFSACSDSKSEWDMPLMYGSPTVDYKTEGRVTDSENNPIPGLKIVLTEKPRNYSNIDNIVTQTLTTDAEGKFISEKILEPVNYFGTLTITDIDGEANGGEFKEQTVELWDLETTIDKSNQDDWYWGVVTFEANITMLKQEEGNE